MFKKHSFIKSALSVFLAGTLTVLSAGAANLPETSSDIEFTYNADMSFFEEGPITEEKNLELSEYNLSANALSSKDFDVYFEDGAMVWKTKKNMPSGSQASSINSYFNLIKDGTRKYYEICFAPGLQKQIKFAFACPTGAYNSFMAIDMNNGGNFNMYANANKKTGKLPETVLNFNPFSTPLKSGEICVIRMLFDTENDEIDAMWWARESENYNFIRYNPFGDINAPIGYATYYETESNNRFSTLDIYSTGIGAYAEGDEALRLYYIRSWADITSKLELAERELTDNFENIPDASGVVDKNIVLPTEIFSYPELEVIWESENPEIISNDGAVNLPSANTEVTLNAYIRHKDGSFADIEWKVPYKVTVVGTDSENYIVEYDSFIGAAGLEKWTKSTTGGSMFIDENGLNIEKNDAGTLFAERKFGQGTAGFSVSGKVTFEATLATSGGASDIYVKGSNGENILKLGFFHDGYDSVFTCGYKGEEWINYGGRDIKFKAVLDTVAGKMDLYYQDMLVAEGVEFLEEATDISELYCNVSDGSLYIKKIMITIPSSQRLSMVESQLDWNKISPDLINNVTYLNLFERTLAGVGVEWRSNKPDSVLADGTVMRMEAKEDVELIAKIYKQENPDDYVEKIFNITIPEIDKGNLAYHKEIITDLISENDSKTLTDGSRNSVFASQGREKLGAVTVDLGEKMPVDTVIICEKDNDTVYAIEAFEIQVSNDKNTWETVYSGSSIGGEKSYEFEPVIARYVRVNITDKVSNASIRIAEFEVRFEAEDSVIVEADAKKLSYNAEYEIKSDITLPLSGVFGSSVSWESSAPTIIDNTGKLISKPLKDTVVTLVANITKGEAKTTKSFKHVVIGSSSGIITAGPGGGGGGGGSSSGGGGGGGGSVAIPVSTPQAQSIIPAPVTNNDAFSDLASVEWAKESIKKLKELGVVSGSGDNKYEPLREVSREEFIKMLLVTVDGEVADYEKELPFADCSSYDWYYKYVAKAFESGLVMGMTNDSFGIGVKITRQDMAVMIARILEKLNIDISSENAPKVFADSTDISSYATDAVNKLSALGILNGDQNGNFNPKAPANRAEAAHVMFKLLSVVEESKQVVVEDVEGKVVEDENIS